MQKRIQKNTSGLQSGVTVPGTGLLNMCSFIWQSLNTKQMNSNASSSSQLPSLTPEEVANKQEQFPHANARRITNWCHLSLVMGWPIMVSSQPCSSLSKILGHLSSFPYDNPTAAACKEAEAIPEMPSASIFDTMPLSHDYCKSSSSY